MRMRTTLLRLVPVALALSAASSAYALSPVACTMDAKLCPDGETYVGRDGNNNCEWQKCPGEGGASAFRDVPSDHSNAEAIAYVKEHGIVEGYVDGTYKPDATINRAEFVKILVGAYNKQLEEDGIAWEDSRCIVALDPEIGGPFSDVPTTAWYAGFVCRANSQGFVSGYPDGTFRPANSINFAEAAKILSNAYGLLASTTIPACDGDCPWYRDFVISLETRAAIPTSITSFDQKITRGQMAEMIYRLKTEDRTKQSKTYDGIASGGNVFFLDTLAVGQKFGGMTVKEYVPDEGVSFEGSVTLTVTYNDLRYGESYMMPQSVCVEPKGDPSVRQLPVLSSDTDPWYCFEPSALLDRFPKSTGGTATVVIDRYHVNLIGAEITNMARLSDVVRVEATRELPRF